MEEHLATHVLSEIEDALAEVERRGAAASSAFYASGSDLAAMQLAEAASDAVAAGRGIVAAQRTATTSTLSMAAQLKSLSPAAEWVMIEETAELTELRIAWKSWFYFVRALCDHAYRLLLASAQGRAAMRGGSMNSAVKPQNPVAIVLDEREPGFIPWFERFREQRNEVKDGVNFGFSALAGAGISITFNVFGFDSKTGRRSVHFDSTGDRKVTLTDVLETARMLAKVLAVVASAHEEPRPH